ncbi:MAG: hypothetical protein SXQ77_02920, partial [Halobacteria archaeon]|nr:hypothetical protein [Halobacteria archaeon]
INDGSELDSQGAVEKVFLKPDDSTKSRIRTRTDAGTEIGIAVSDELSPGDIVYRDDEKTVVVEFEQVEMMVIESGSDNGNFLAGLRLGHVLGNQHLEMEVDDDDNLSRIRLPVSRERGRTMERNIRPHIPDGAEIRYTEADYDEVSRGNHAGHSHDHRHSHEHSHTQTPIQNNGEN